MTDVEYEHECSRAELLGLPKPTREEFLSRQKEIPREVNADEEEIAGAEAEETEVRKEGFQRITGGLDELNSILSSTQKKLNRFKTVCGSFSNVLKLHMGAKKEETPDDSMRSENESTETLANPQDCTKANANSELDKLDSLINKAERAELSLSSQNKQMKKFLK